MVYYNTNDWGIHRVDTYTLYLDESTTHKNGLKQAFSIGGFIIKDDDIDKLHNDLNTIKTNIWGDLVNCEQIILHEKELKDAIEHRIPNSKLSLEYRRFRRNNTKVELLYKNMSELIKKSPIYTLGCVVIKDNYHNSFPGLISNEISLVCMQIILENYTHFLYQHDATGKIVYESRGSEDKVMLMRFYQVATIGTMYVKPESIQQRVSNLSFVSKKDNIAGLQVADFVPNQIARKGSGKNIKSVSLDLTNNIYYKAYSGYNKNKSRYGIKVVPRIE